MTTRAPSRRWMRLQWRLHKLVWNISGGRLGRRAGGMRTLQLTTTGHKSGLPRTILIWYVEHAGGYAIAGTNAGADRDPAWVENLRANPRASVVVDGETFAATGRFLQGDEHATVWRKFEEAHESYRDYARLLSRPIPLVLLESE